MFSVLLKLQSDPEYLANNELNADTMETVHVVKKAHYIGRIPHPSAMRIGKRERFLTHDVCDSSLCN